MTAVSIVSASVAAIRRQTCGPVAAVTEPAVLIVVAVDATPVPLVVAVASAIGTGAVPFFAHHTYIGMNMPEVLGAKSGPAELSCVQLHY